MPFSVTFIADLALIVIRVDGDLTVNLIGELHDALLAHPNYHPDIKRIADLRSAGIAPESFMIREFAKRGPFSDGDALGVVLVAEAVHFGLARMYSAYLTEDRNANFFVVCTVREASERLGIAEDRLMRVLVDSEDHSDWAAT